MALLQQIGRLALGLLVLLAGNGINVVDGAIVINEIMINPLGTVPPLRYIELKNTNSVEAVSLKGWHLHADIKDSDEADYRIDPTLTYNFQDTDSIPANGHLVIGSSAAPYVNAVWANFPSFPVNGTTIGKGNNYIYIHGTDKGDFDYVEWDANNADRRLPFAPGASLHRSPGASPATREWKVATTPIDGTTSSDSDKGTPGKDNTPIDTPRLTGLDLYNAKRDTKIATLTPGASMSLALPDGMNRRNAALNVVATYDKNASTPKVESVVFGLNAKLSYSIEAKAPYALCGNDGNDMFSCGSSNLGCGTHIVTATPFDGPNGTGKAGTPLVVTFSITGARCERGSGN